MVDDDDGDNDDDSNDVLDVPSLKSLPIITTYHSKAYIDIGASICQDS